MTRLRRRLILATAHVADRVHARPDEAARAAGLTVARTGLTGRTYRHPYFDTRRSS